MGGLLRIGQVAARAGVTPKAIRFYEVAGVLPAPARGRNGYRLYRDEAVDVLQFVRRAAGLGLTLAEIKEIVAIRQGGRPPCSHVHRLLQDKARELDHKLQDLMELRRRLRRSLEAWNRQPMVKAAVCPHIEGRMDVSPTRAGRAGSPRPRPRTRP
jgi:MerR family copper efflux transcriptional regulator